MYVLMYLLLERYMAELYQVPGIYIYRLYIHTYVVVSLQHYRMPIKKTKEEYQWQADTILK